MLACDQRSLLRMLLLYPIMIHSCFQLICPPVGFSPNKCYLCIPELFQSFFPPVLAFLERVVNIKWENACKMYPFNMNVLWVGCSELMTGWKWFVNDCILFYLCFTEYPNSIGIGVCILSSPWGHSSWSPLNLLTKTAASNKAVFMKY